MQNILCMCVIKMGFSKKGSSKKKSKNSREYGAQIRRVTRTKKIAATKISKRQRNALKEYKTSLLREYLKDPGVLVVSPSDAPVRVTERLIRGSGHSPLLEVSPSLRGKHYYSHHGYFYLHHLRKKYRRKCLLTVSSIITTEEDKVFHTIEKTNVGSTLQCKWTNLRKEVFIPILYGIGNEEGDGHAFVVFLFPREHSAYIFDPNGAKTIRSPSSYPWWYRILSTIDNIPKFVSSSLFGSDKLKDPRYFFSLIGVNVKLFLEDDLGLEGWEIVTPEMWCPKFSFHDSSLGERSDEVYDGYCMFWSVWFIEYVLKNSPKDSRGLAELLRRALEELEDNYSGNYYKFIRGYTSRMEKIYAEYVTKYVESL